MTVDTRNSKMLDLMRKVMIKLVLVAFVLMYAHQAVEHVGHVHGGEVLLSGEHMHLHDNSGFEDSHRHYLEDQDDAPVSHEHNGHQHFTEIHPKKLKPSRKILTKSLPVVSISNSSLVSVPPLPERVFIEGLGTKVDSSIPVYLCVQSFLI